MQPPPSPFLFRSISACLPATSCVSVLEQLRLIVLAPTPHSHPVDLVVSPSETVVFIVCQAPAKYIYSTVYDGKFSQAGIFVH